MGNKDAKYLDRVNEVMTKNEVCKGFILLHLGSYFAGWFNFFVYYQVSNNWTKCISCKYAENKYLSGDKIVLLL